MVDMHTYAFVFMVVGLVAVVATIAYTIGDMDGKARARTPRRTWTVAEVSVDANTIAFHVRHQNHGYSSGSSHEIAQAPADDDDAVASARARAEQRAEEYTTRQVVPR